MAAMVSLYILFSLACSVVRRDAGGFVHIVASTVAGGTRTGLPSMGFTLAPWWYTCGL